MIKTKSYRISKNSVVAAWESVKANKGTYGVDEQSIKDFSRELKGNLYKVWNRMSSGTYFPPAVDAVGVARRRCWRQDWVIDLDIKGFFDNLDHELMMKAVRYHTDEKWIHLYVERWLKAPLQQEDGQLIKRDKGTPQGGLCKALHKGVSLAPY